MKGICQVVLYMVMFHKSVPESKPSDVAEEGAWDIQMHQLAFRLEMEIMECFTDCNITVKGKNKEHLTPIFFVYNMKTIIAGDKSNGMQNSFLLKDM
eukprot:5317161-Ditylum_brightwellii.AAC.1